MITYHNEVDVDAIIIIRINHFRVRTYVQEEGKMVRNDSVSYDCNQYYRGDQQLIVCLPPEIYSASDCQENELHYWFGVLWQ